VKPPDELDAERMEARLHVVQAAEQVLGEERFGGWWLEPPSGACIGIAVEPSQHDLDTIYSAARGEGWRVEFVAVRYSRARLVGMIEAVDAIPRPGDAWVALGWDPRMNNIAAALPRWDAEAVSWLREHFPEDALVIRIFPDAGWPVAR